MGGEQGERRGFFICKARSSDHLSQSILYGSFDHHRSPPQAELEQMQSKHSSEVTKLQKHIDDLDNQVIRMQMTVVKATASGQQTNNRWGKLVSLKMDKYVHVYMNCTTQYIISYQSHTRSQSSVGPPLILRNNSGEEDIPSQREPD